MIDKGSISVLSFILSISLCSESSLVLISLPFFLRFLSVQPQRGRRSLALHLVRHGNVSAATNAPGSWDAPTEEMRDSNEPKLNSLNIMDALKNIEFDT